MSDEASAVVRFVWAHLARKVERAGFPEEARALREHVDLAEVLDPADLPSVPSLRVQRFEVRRRVGELVVELNASDASLLSWLFPPARLPAGKDLGRDQALQIAERAAAPPAGAVLTEAEYQDVGGDPVFVAAWAHEEDGLPVERDYLRVFVNGRTGQPFSVSRRWHVVDLNATVR
jgi:hypothetical protein